MAKIIKILVVVIAFIVVGISIVLLKDRNRPDRLFTGTNYNFRLSYPKLWFIQELGNDAVTAPGIYFSPQKTDFNDPYRKLTPTFVRISVRPVDDWLDLPENKTRAYTDAKDVLDAIWQEEQQLPMPRIPGPPRFKSFAQGFSEPGAVEVSSIETAYYEPDARQYLILHQGDIYNILVGFDESLSSRDQMMSQVDQILKSFKFTK